MRARWFFLGAALALAAAAASCGGSGTSGAGSSTTGGGATGGGGAGGAGGAGGSQPVKCTAAADCPGQDSICAARTCDSQVCGLKILLEDMPLPSQAYGDCKAVRCDEKGNLVTANDDADAYDDGNPCTDDTCKDGAPANTPKAKVPCGDATKPLFCNASAACVECLDDSQCTAARPRCSALGKCVLAACIDMAQDGAETAVDCGGPDCAACPDTSPCKVNSDCQSAFCKGIGVNKTCQAPACDDGQKNGDETDVDCGGKACAPLGSVCIVEQRCAAGSDCETKVCKAGLCAAASCTDAVQNGDEAGVDCGGSCKGCPK